MYLNIVNVELISFNVPFAHIQIEVVRRGYVSGDHGARVVGHLQQRGWCDYFRLSRKNGAINYQLINAVVADERFNHGIFVRITAADRDSREVAFGGGYLAR